MSKDLKDEVVHEWDFERLGHGLSIDKSPGLSAWNILQVLVSIRWRTMLSQPSTHAVAYTFCPLWSGVYVFGLGFCRVTRQVDLGRRGLLCKWADSTAYAFVIGRRVVVMETEGCLILAFLCYFDWSRLWSELYHFSSQSVYEVGQSGDLEPKHKDEFWVILRRLGSRAWQ